MAWFTKKEWKNRLAEFAGRRTLTDVATGTSQVVDVARNEGTISQEGDAFSAANMNDFEQRILEGFIQAENAATDLNQNFQDGVNTIVSAVNTKAGTSLTGANTPAEIADVITNIKTKPTIKSGKTYAKSCGGSSCSMTAGCYEYYVVVTFSCKADVTPTISVTNGAKTVLQSQKAPVSSANDYITYTTILKIVTTKTASVVKVSYSSSEWGDYTCDWIGLVL